jgi:cellulose biosynthesis protein BcsQ
MQLFENISHKSTEKDIEQKIIVPLLKAWGYQESDWQRQVPLGTKRADCIIYSVRLGHDKIPYCVIEIKAPRHRIDTQIWQLYDYLRRSQALFGLLTNGFAFRLVYYNQQVMIPLAQYDQQQFQENYQLISKVLSHRTSIQVGAYRQKVTAYFHRQVVLKLQQVFPHLATHPMMTTTATEAPAPLGCIITVFNNKGGVGKTTTTLNLAAALNHLGKRILLIDIDPQANLTTGLGINPLLDVEKQGKKDITHLLTEVTLPVDDVIYAKHWHKVGLEIVPSHIRLSDMEATLMSIVDVDRVLQKKLQRIRSNYDYILIDPPPSFGKVNNIALMASDYVLIPTQLAPYPIRALEYVMNRILSVQQSREGKLSVLGVAVSMYNRAATKQVDEMLGEISKILDAHPLGSTVQLFPQSTWIPQRNMVANVAGKGYPLIEAEYDDMLSPGEKEAALDAFTCYLELARYVITQTSGVIN